MLSTRGWGNKGAGGLCRMTSERGIPAPAGSTSLGALPAATTTLKIQILGLERIRWQCRELVCGVTLAAWNLTQQELLLCSAFPTSALRINHSWNDTCSLPRGANSCLCSCYLMMAPKCFLVLTQTWGAASKIILAVVMDHWRV